MKCLARDNAIFHTTYSSIRMTQIKYPFKCDLTIKMSRKKYIEGIDILDPPAVRKKSIEKIPQLKERSTGSAHGAEKMPDRS